MIGKIDINNPDERGLLPYPVILAATKGDPDAMKIVMQQRKRRKITAAQYRANRIHSIYGEPLG